MSFPMAKSLESVKSPRIGKLQQFLLDFKISILGYLALLLVATLLYVSKEHTIYYWDYANYENITERTLVHFQQAPRDIVNYVYQSFSLNYNTLFTLPLLPFILFLGKTRIAFEIGLVTVYLFPFLFGLGKLAEVLFPQTPKRAFWITLFVAIMIPMIWAPTMRGFPDAGAGALVVFAVWRYLQAQNSTSFLNNILIGILLAFAMLLRRHMIYGVINFLIIASFFALVELWAQFWKDRLVFQKALRKFILQMMTIGVSMVLVLVSIGLPFLKLVLGTNFTQLYSSYLYPWYAVVQKYGVFFGWSIVFLAITGLAWLLKTTLRSSESQNRIWIIVWSVSSCLIWTFLVRQEGSHQGIHYIPAIVIGISSLVMLIWERVRRWPKYAANAIVLLLLAGNLAFGLFPLTIPGTLGGFQVRSVFAYNWQPLQRNDLGELFRLVEDLRSLTPDQQQVYVAASSTIINSDILSNAERDFFGSGNTTLNLATSEIDSRDGDPLDLLAKSSFAVLATPLQLHLEPERQQVVRKVYDLFAGKGPADFQLLPGKYTLQNGVVVQIYKRVQ